MAAMDGRRRQDIHPGLLVEVVLKQDQRTGKRTRGVVRDILTPSPNHPRGIKVRLASGEVGRVQAILIPEKKSPEEPGILKEEPESSKGGDFP
jgi:uncharacterized repeat protein (TIGR03833 family)